MATYLTNQFLIAMPAMEDANFAQTVTLVCEHSERGALGIVINRTLPMTLGEVFDQLGLDSSKSRASSVSIKPAVASSIMTWGPNFLISPLLPPSGAKVTIVQR